MNSDPEVKRYFVGIFKPYMIYMYTMIMCFFSIYLSLFISHIFFTYVSKLYDHVKEYFSFELLWLFFVMHLIHSLKIIGDIDRIHGLEPQSEWLFYRKP